MKQSVFHCIKWKLQPAIDFLLLENNTLLYLPRNFTYGIGEYLLHDDHASVCIPEDTRPPFYYVDLLYIVAWILSIVALTLAFISHWTLSSAVTTIYDPRPLMCHMISLFSFYVLVLFYQVGPDFSREVCYILAIWGQYSLRAAFCWLNIVTFDMWRRFHHERIFIAPVRASCFTYSCQSLYAWGVPAVIIIVSNLLIFVDGSVIHGYKERCLVSMYENGVQVIFFYASTSATLIGNILFFALTCVNLRKLGSSIEMANSKIHSQMLKMYMKLLIVTGICWILEVMEWALIPLKPNPEYWIAPDVLNALQGLFLFLIYTCNSNTHSQLKQRFFSNSQLSKRSSVQSRLSTSTTV